MSASDQDLFGTMIKVENKDIFIDLKKNVNGMYLKLSERNGKSRNTVLIPATGIERLRAVLDDVINISSSHAKINPDRRHRMFDNHGGVMSNSVYVSGLAWSTTNEILGTHFMQVGHVENAVVLTKSRNGKAVSLGCGVVEFRSPEEAIHAVNMLNNSELDGRIIKCREDRAIDAFHSGHHIGQQVQVPLGVRPGCGGGMNGGMNRDYSDSNKSSSKAPTVDRVLDPNRVFVTSLPWDSSSTDVASIFSSVGHVLSADVLSTKKGRSLGHAVVEFANPSEASRAILELNGRELDGRKVIVREFYMD